MGPQKKFIFISGGTRGIGRAIALTQAKEETTLFLNYLRDDESASKTKKEADALYKRFLKEGVEVFYDDRDVSAGEKFSDSDLIGIPFRVVISKKTIADNGRLEVKERKTGKIKKLNFKQVLQLIK